MIQRFLGKEPQVDESCWVAGNEAAKIGRGAAYEEKTHID